MKRSISTLGLLLTSLSAIIGSGWLFSAYYTASLAGPGSLLAWLLGGVFALIIAFVFAEVCALLPLSGSSTRIPQITHGTVVSFTFAWIIWLSYISIMAIEVQSVLQYASYYFPILTKSSGGLTRVGFLVAVILMLLISVINVYSVRWLVRFNSFLTVLKLFVLLVIGVIVWWGARCLYGAPISQGGIHWVLTQPTGWFPLGAHGVFSALVSGGILFAFNGFKQAAEMAGEAKNPARAVPLAILGSVLISVLLFLFLQWGFLSSLNENNLKLGWHALVLPHQQSPWAAILSQNKQVIFLPILYLGAIIAPLAAGLMYCSAASRSLYGMAQGGYAPEFLGKLSAHHHPSSAIWVNFLIGLFLFLPLPGWNTMVSFMSSLLAMTYAIGPLSLISLRYQLPKAKRPIRLPFVKLWGWAGFYICTLLAYWSGWETLWKMMVAIIIGFLMLGIFYRAKKNKNKNKNIARDLDGLHGLHGLHDLHDLHDLHWKGAVWLWPYLIGLCVFSYLGAFGGIEALSNFWEYFLQAVFSLIIFILATHWSVPRATVEATLKKLSFSMGSNNF